MITQVVAEKRASVINPLHPRDPGLADMFGLGRTSASGEAVTASTALRVNAFMAGVNYLSRTIASLPLEVYQRMEPRGRKKARGHRLYRPLHAKPNRFQTSFEWRVMMLHHVILRGNFYCRITPDGRLVPLHPDRVTPFWAPNGDRAYEYQPPSGKPAELFDRIILQSEMFHVMFMPDDGLKGRSVIEYQVDTLGRALAEQKYTATLQRVGTRLSGVLKVKKRLSPEAKMSLRQQWQERNAGVGNAGTTAILEEDMDWSPVSMTNQDAQAAEMMELGREDAAIMLNIPPHKVGANRRSTFSNIEHQSIEAVQDGIRPWCVNIEQVGNETLFTEADRQQGYYMEFNIDGLLRGDFLSRQQGLEVQRRNGIISGNDWADTENMNEFDGGDKRYVPLNWVELVGEVEPEAGGGEPVDPAAEVQQLALNGAQIASLLTVLQQVTAKQLSPVTAKEMLKVSFPTLAPAQVDRLVDSAEQFVPALLEAARAFPGIDHTVWPFIRMYARRPGEQRSMDLMRRLRSAHQPLFADGFRRVLRREADSVEREFRRQAQSRSLAEFVAWSETFYSDYRTQILLTLSPIVNAFGETVARSAEEMIGADAVDVDAFMSQYVGALVARHITSSRADLLTLLNSDEPSDVLERASSVFANWRGERGQRSASREVVRLSNAVARNVWEASGVQQLSWWRSANCPECGDRAGQIVMAGGSFAGDVQHPPVGDECDCMLIPVTGG